MRTAPATLLLLLAGLAQPPAQAGGWERREERREPQQQQQQRGPEPERPPPQFMPQNFAPQNRGLSSGQAAQRAQQMNGGGRVLAVDPTDSGYRVRVLKDGEVRSVYVPGQ